MKRWVPMVVLFAAAALIDASCDCSGSARVNQPDGGPTDGGGPGSICLATNNSCSVNSGGVCCSGVCSNGSCAPATYCGGPSTSCTVNTDCCSNHCLNGACSAQQCFDIGMTCSSNSDCCTATCPASHSCAPIPGSPGTCNVLGQACNSPAACCSTNCQGGVCVRAYSCQANGDLCLRDSDCCGNVCSANDGGAGYCVTVTGGGGGGCTEDGNPCSGGTNCCSRTCVDPGSGAMVCQPVDGCRLTGDFCLSTNACCGGGPNPNGTVMCATGRCNNGQACNGAGNICGSARLPDGGTLTINAPQDCCDGHRTVCKIDSSGVPRCFGGCPGNICSSSCPTGYTGQAPCCIATSQSCQFSNQCCGGARCLPGDGGFFCSSATCQPLAGTCTASADCCSGLACAVPSGSTTGTCQSGSCPGLGQRCSVQSLCCSGLDCKTPSLTLCTSSDPSCTCNSRLN